MDIRPSVSFRKFIWQLLQPCHFHTQLENSSKSGLRIRGRFPDRDRANGSLGCQFCEQKCLGIVLAKIVTRSNLKISNELQVKRTFSRQRPVLFPRRIASRPKSCHHYPATKPDCCCGQQRHFHRCRDGHDSAGLSMEVQWRKSLRRDESNV